MPTRGKLPRSFRIDPTDPLYGTPFQTNAYSYDNALALICSAIRRPALADEIAGGIILSPIGTGTIPFTADFLTGAGIGTYVQNNDVAMTAYALGYFLEYNPLSIYYCAIAELLRDILNYLQQQREWVYCSGLIIDGRDTSGILTEDYVYITTEIDDIIVTEDSLASSVRTEDNILAYYAFQQAARVFNETYYITTAIELRTAIINRLWSDTEMKFWFGLTTNGTPISVNMLNVSAYGSLFMHEIGDDAKALLCLQKCEVFACVDMVNGCNGYRTWIEPHTIVNFEMSYAVALGYYRQDNQTKFNSIRNELNRYIDLTDGGQIGALIKKYLDEDMVSYKAVGSTAWSIITDVLKARAFTIKTSPYNIPVDCYDAFYNTMQHQVFTKQGCPTGTHPSTFDYIVPAGRYFSFTSVADANALALAEIAANGQDYVNANGQCIPDASFGNVYMEDFFFNDGCPGGTTPNPYLFSVPANTFYGVTQVEANGLAADYLETEGPNQAAMFGTCTALPTSIHVDITVRWEYVSGTYHIFAKATATTPMPIYARVYYQILDIDGSPILTPGTFLHFNAGDQFTVEQSSGTVFSLDSTLVFSGDITSVVPNHSGTITFNWY